ncbi:MAG: universal stress protein [Armatimonadota bacterium]
MRNIAVGYDGTRSSEVAAQQAIGLAEATGGRIYLVTVITTSDEDLGGEIAPREPDIADLALGPQVEDAGHEERGVEAPAGLEELRRRCRDLHLACEQERLFGRHAGVRLLRRSRTCELLVIGRGDERRPGVIGRNATFLLSSLVAPTMVCARQHVELRSVLVPYKLSTAGGRGLSFAAGLCETVNARLHVVVCEPRSAIASEAVEAVRRYLLAYRVEGDVDVSPTPPHEAVHSAAMEREASLIVVPGAHRRYYLFPWQRNETLWRALQVPGAVVVAYP